MRPTAGVGSAAILDSLIAGADWTGTAGNLVAHVSQPALRGALELIPYLTGEGGQGIGVENLLLISERATPVDIFEHQAAPATGGHVPRDDMKVDLGIDIHEECVVQLVRAEQRCERAHQSA